MAENNNQSIFIINQGGYDSSGQEVTQAEYDAWVNENAVTALDSNGDKVSIVGGDDKISVTDGTTTVGYDNVVQPSNGTGATSYNTAVRQAADDTITNDQALALLQENVTNALALKESIITELNALGRDPEKSLTTIDGQQAFTLDAAEAGIDAAYAALYGYKDNLPALIAELQDLALQTIAEYQADVEGGLTVTLPNDIGPFDGRVTSTTVDTTGSNLAKSSITSLADVATDTTLPTIDEGDTKIQTVEVTANTSASKVIRDSLGLDYQGPIVEKLIDKAINLGLNQIPGYKEINSVIGATNKVIQIGDIATNVGLSPAETALALARLFIPQVNLLVNGYNLVTGGGGGGIAESELATIPVNTTADPQAGGAGGPKDPPPDEVIDAPEDVSANEQSLASPRSDATFLEANLAEVAAVGTFAVEYNVANGTYDVVDIDTGEVVFSNLSRETAIQVADALSAGDNGAALEIIAQAENDAQTNNGPDNVTIEQDPNLYPHGLPYDDEGNLNPGWAINPETGEPYYIGGDYIDPTTLASANASREAFIQSRTKKAQAQAAIEAQRKQANEGDWRVKLRLAAGADYLYRDPELNQDGVLWPLNVTDGVVFPYTPQIQTTYGANYNAYDLTHSNYRGYFYQNSYVDEIQIQATFTAQDTSEANYMLAVIHFFKSVTKMFYGQDAQRGMPPPLVFLQGLGEFQFNLHPCVVKTFNYQLPNNVDYIRARSVSVDGTNLLKRRDRQTLSTAPSLLQIARLLGSGLQTGALTTTPAPPTLGTNNPTYVPTKIDISLGLLPIQSRSQVSKQFSVKQFANGDLLKGGFW
jgi:hypothetical protein